MNAFVMTLTEAPDTEILSFGYRRFLTGIALLLSGYLVPVPEIFEVLRMPSITVTLSAV